MREASRAECRVLIARVIGADCGDAGSAIQAAAAAFVLKQDLGFAARCLRAGLDPDVVREAVGRPTGPPAGAGLDAPQRSYVAFMEKIV